MSERLDIQERVNTEYWQDAEDIVGITGEQKYNATEWEQARRSYASALAFSAYSSLWEQAKQELTEEVEQFESDAQDFGCDDPQITFSLSCLHGWASHDREDADGLMFFESRQLDGCNGLAKKTDCGLWLSVCFTPSESEQKGTVQS
jgi:hypothetical protein